MTILNSGTTKQYSENWAQAFAKKSRKTTAKKTDSPKKKAAAKKKSVPKKRAAPKSKTAPKKKQT